MPSILDIIENKGLDLKKTDYYAAILGESPSKGAKSPSLWNAAFENLGLSGMMHPMDIRPEKLKEVVRCLRDDERFIGGAVTMPYKITIIPYLDALESEVKTIGAVNCLYCDGKRLVGANTDGAGALWSLQGQMSETLAGKTVLLLGTGGAGFAVAAYLASAVGPEGQLAFANRSRDSRDKLAVRIQGACRVETIDWPIAPGRVSGVDVLVNCSSIGFETLKRDEDGSFSLKFYTPLGPVDDAIRAEDGEDAEKCYLKAAAEAVMANFGHSIDVLSAMDDPFVFDIIYQPRQTMLLFLADLMGYRTLNGVPMNLEQAVIAFDKATVAAGMRGKGTDEVRRIMGQVC
jgi:shikimate dehydrogenase